MSNLPHANVNEKVNISEKVNVNEKVPPLFSVITVTYNAADTIGATLKSVSEQSFGLYEHIVMDGASKDETMKICRGCTNPRLAIYSSPDDGIYDAMNKALDVATGSYVIFMNAGDKFHSPDTLLELSELILDNDFPGVVFGQTDIVDAAGRYLGPRHLTAPTRLTLASFAEGMVVCHQSFVALRKLTDRYNLAFKFSADYEWCIRVLQRSRRNVYYDGVIADYLNEGVTTRNRYKSLRERFKIMCYYYGTWATILRHIKFIPRFLRSQKAEKNRNRHKK